ncbi:recombinase family protein [Filifactor alocis]
MKFGYIRVSSTEQNESRQIEELLKHNVLQHNIFIDKLSGKNFEREQYQKLKIKVRCGDEIYFHELDRLGRNKQEIKQELLDFKKQGVMIRFLDIPTTLMNFNEFGEMQKSIMEMVNNILIEVLSTQAETELVKIRKRQAEGIAIAKAQGKYTGRKAKPLPGNFEKLYRRWKNKEISGTEFTKILGYKSRSTFYLKIKQYEKINCSKN